MKDTGVFIQLDRLSGSTLSVFYLHCADKSGFDRFNRSFTSKLGLRGKVTLPCVVFFKLVDGGFSDTTVVSLDRNNIIFAFHELHNMIVEYLKKADGGHTLGVASLEDKSVQGAKVKEGGRGRAKAIRWIRSTSMLLSIEVVRGAIAALLGHVSL